jgi:outer membrane protein OmpA-like peptidoglycan-associated protein
MIMNKNFSINVKSKFFTTSRLMISFFSILFITSCAQNDIIMQEDHVLQVQNLDDYDNDGVIEARDTCDGTVVGASIDNYGCGSQTSSIEPLKINLKFTNNSYSLPSSAYERINELAEFLNKHPKLQVNIEGHTSKVGGVTLNQQLSEKRAKALATVLVNDYNIAAERVSSAGYGFEKLEVKGDTDEAHAMNRRIMAELTHVKYVDDMKWTIYTVVEAL